MRQELKPIHRTGSKKTAEANRSVTIESSLSYEAIVRKFYGQRPAGIPVPLIMTPQSTSANAESSCHTRAADLLPLPSPLQANFPSSSLSGNIDQAASNDIFYANF